MSEPFDLDAAVTEQAGEPFRFTWAGEEYTLPGILDRDIEEQLRLVTAIEELDDKSVSPAKLLEILQIIVGADVLTRMRERKPVGGRAVMTLIHAWIEHQGPSLGKSAASTPSSNGTAQPSRRTSRSGRARRTS